MLEEFGEHPSFSGIKSDCQSIVSTLKSKLKEQFVQAEVSYYFSIRLLFSNDSGLKNKYLLFFQVTSRELEESVSLLCKLNESSSDLAQQFIVINRARLEKDLESISSNIAAGGAEDAVQLLVEKSCNTVLNNVALTTATFNNIFATSPSDIKGYAFHY